MKTCKPELTKEDEALLYKSRNFHDLSEEEYNQLSTIYKKLATLKRLENWNEEN